jgi:ankyrin repeat protein
MSKILLSYIFKTNLSSFRAAILANNTNKICRILDIERNYISNELDNAGNTALLLAIKYASPLTVKLLLQQGAHPDQTNFITFQTPLSLLASTTYDDDQTHLAKLALEMATILLDHDAYVDKPSSFESIDENGKEYVIKETPLMTAVRTKNLPMATLFVERQANVNYIEKQSGNRP